MKNISVDVLIAVLGKEKCDSFFLNKKWIRKQKFSYNTNDLKYIIYKLVYRNTKDDGTGNFSGSIVMTSLGLTSLKNQLPEYIRSVDDFIVDDNQLESLEGCPEDVYGDFSCDDNLLKSLKGAPKEVSYDFSCQGNTEIEDLDGISEKIGGDLELRGCNVYRRFEIERTPDGKTYQLVES